MTVSHALLSSLSLAVVTACLAQAQMLSSTAPLPSERVTESRLTGGDPRLVAWGAHDTLAGRDQALVPDLLSLAAQWRALPVDGNGNVSAAALTQEQLDRRDAMAAVLDALIQMNAPVPAETLRLLAPDFGNAVAVLLSRMPPEESGALAFDSYRAKPVRQYGLQYVSASLLALHPVPGFAADLVANTPVDATVFVIAPGAEPLGMGMFGCCGMGSTSLRKDWPFTGQYLLSDRDTKGSLLLVSGGDPIFALRQLSTRYEPEEICGDKGISMTSHARLRLLAEMLGIAPDALGWQSDLQTNIEFRTLSQFQAQVLSFVAGEQAKHRATLALLADRHLVTADEAEHSLPELHLSVRDVRGPNAEPALQPGTLPPHVTWSTPSY